ncbi:MAG: type II secretion system F family protein [Anaerolineae bacterium]|nr:type II secretion system F family protein [Anaerolineae bacterium]
MEFLIAFVGGLSFLAIWVGLTRPKSAARPQQQPDEQERLRELRGGPLGFLSAAVEDVSRWFRGEGTDDATWRGGLNARYLQLLKQADWYWAPGEAAPPTAEAPFWNLETMWARKLLHAGLFGLAGLVLAGAAAAIFHWNPALALLGLLAGLFGFFDPDSEVAGAAETRRRQIILEMGYKVPELRVYVRSGKTFVAAMRYLTSRPGGPFVRELHRALSVYDITADLARGLQMVVERNRMCEPLANLCGDLLAVLSEGGEVGTVLEAHADTAQHEQRRLLRQQGQDNTQQMTYLVSGTTLVVIFVLVGGPALWTVVTSLGGM